MANSVPVKEAVARLIAQYPFFASLLFDTMKLVETDSVPTAATNDVELLVNPDFMADLDIHTRVFVLGHEICHAMWSHGHRFRAYAERGYVEPGYRFDMALMNIAADLVINDACHHWKLGRLWPNCWHRPDLGRMNESVETVYKRLYDKAKEEQQDKESGNGGMAEEHENPDGTSTSHADGVGTGERFDQHRPAPASSNQPNREAVMKRAMISARAAAKARGTMPGSLEEMIEQWLHPEVPWEDELKQCVISRFGSTMSDWRRPRRRSMVLPGIYMPQRCGEGAGFIAVAVDTSGSVGTNELRAFFGVIADILTEHTPERLIVLWCDAKVQAVDEFVDECPDVDALMERAGKVPGRGGTSFDPPFRWLEEEGLVPHQFIYLTDMHCPFPKAPNYPVTWVATSDRKAPWGRTIEMKLETKHV